MEKLDGPMLILQRMNTRMFVSITVAFALSDPLICLIDMLILFIVYR